MKQQRSKWITDSSLQLKVIMVLVIIGAINLLFYILTLFYFFSELEGFIGGLVANGDMPANFFDAQHRLFLRTAIVGFFAQTLIIVVFGIYFSNRISGPVYRLSRVLKGIIAGESVSLVHLRKHDFMKELADNLNRVLVYFSEIEESRSKALTEIAADPGLSEKSKECIQALQRVAPKPVESEGDPS